MCMCINSSENTPLSHVVHILMRVLSLGSASLRQLNLGVPIAQACKGIGCKSRSLEPVVDPNQVHDPFKVKLCGALNTTCLYDT